MTHRTIAWTVQKPADRLVKAVVEVGEMGPEHALLFCSDVFAVADGKALRLTRYTDEITAPKTADQERAA